MLLMNIVWSLNNSVYPHRLIEWVILDNGDKEAEASMPEKCRMSVWLPRIREALNPAIQLRYHTEEANRYSLGELRNRAIAKATAPIIVFMDDDDYYPPESIIARVKALHIRPELRLVGCVRIVNYNIATDKWNMMGMEKYLSEASLAFRRRFWEIRPFARQKCNEIALFIYGREDECAHILSQFVIFSVYHSANFTGDLRQIKTEQKQDIEIELPAEILDRLKQWIK
jgi:glycosyltransferase involved in cell wall biosynthesis